MTPRRFNPNRESDERRDRKDGRRQIGVGVIDRAGDTSHIGRAPESMQHGRSNSGA
jgi:hypothetical protein